MKKFILLIDILNEIEYSISMKLDDKVLKFFRKTENIMKDFQNKDEFDLYTIELRNCFIKYLANSL